MEFEFKGLNAAGEWVQGKNIFTALGGPEGMEVYIMQQGQPLNILKGTTQDILVGHWDKVDPITVCQATNLPDKNKKIIFDADILRFPPFDMESEHFPESFGQVVMDDGGWCVKFDNADMEVLDAVTAAAAEIVGNAWDTVPDVPEGCVTLLNRKGEGGFGR